MQDVMAAIATDPCRIVAVEPPTSTVTPSGARRHRREGIAEVRRQVLEQHAVLRPSRSRQRRGDRAEIEDQCLVERGAVAGQPPQALRLRVPLDQVDALGAIGR